MRYDTISGGDLVRLFTDLAQSTEPGVQLSKADMLLLLGSIRHWKTRALRAEAQRGRWERTAERRQLHIDRGSIAFALKEGYIRALRSQVAMLISTIAAPHSTCAHSLLTPADIARAYGAAIEQVQDKIKKVNGTGTSLRVHFKVFCPYCKMEETAR